MHHVMLVVNCSCTGVLMELRDKSLCAGVLDDLDDNYKTLTEWLVTRLCMYFTVMLPQGL